MRRIAVILILFLLVACASPVSRENFSAKPSSGKGYIAGGFLHSQREGYGVLALELVEQVNKKKILIKLQPPNKSREIDIVPVDPGIYKMVSLATLAAAGGYLDNSLITLPELTKPFQVQSGIIYYIGNYEGKSSKNNVKPSFKMGDLLSGRGGVDWDGSIIVTGRDIDSVKSVISEEYIQFYRLDVVDVYHLKK